MAPTPPDKPKVISTNRARGGIGTHVVRYVLVISTVAAVIAMAWVWLAAPKATAAGGPGPAGGTPATPPPPAPR